MITKIIIAEDDTFTYSCYHNFLSNEKDIEIVGHAQNGEDAITLYKDKEPDILILDLNLPKKNGLDVLMELANFEFPKPKCNVIIVSGEDKMLHNLLNTRKVFMEFRKPADLNEILNSIKDFQKEQFVESILEIKCEEALIKLNINPLSKNGRLLKEAIQTCYFNYEMMDNMELLYFTLSRRKSCSPQKIKSALRSAVDFANRFNSLDALNTFFYTEIIENNVSTKQFINGMIYSLQNKSVLK